MQAKITSGGAKCLHASHLSGMVDGRPWTDNRGQSSRKEEMQRPFAQIRSEAATEMVGKIRMQSCFHPVPGVCRDVVGVVWWGSGFAEEAARHRALEWWVISVSQGERIDRHRPAAREGRQTVRSHF